MFLSRSSENLRFFFKQYNSGTQIKTKSKELSKFLSGRVDCRFGGKERCNFKLLGRVRNEWNNSDNTIYPANLVEIEF